MNNPKVTIITATYNLIKNNRRDYFIQALESVHNQSYDNIEHLIIDGASNDGTVELLEEYSKKGWIKYISEPDKGIYDAFNKGIMKATGKYIAFLNSDDYYIDEDGISLSVDKLEKNKAVFSYSNTIYLLQDGKKFFCKSNLMNLFVSTPFSHVSMLISRKTLCSLGKFDTNFKIAADYNLILKLFIKKSKYVYIPKYYCIYREGGFSCDDKSKTEDDRLNAMVNAFLPNVITRKQAEKLANNNVSWLLISNILNIFGVKGLFCHFFNKLHSVIFNRKLIAFRFSKKKTYFILFGINIVGKR